jgi:hypothetical protein
MCEFEMVTSGETFMTMFMKLSSLVQNVLTKGAGIVQFA